MKQRKILYNLYLHLICRTDELVTQSDKTSSFSFVDRIFQYSLEESAQEQCHMGRKACKIFRYDAEPKPKITDHFGTTAWSMILLY